MASTVPHPSPRPPGPDPVEAARTLRAFNRFYTQRIGVLQEGLAGSRLTLTESRVLWELAQAAHPTAPAHASAGSPCEVPEPPPATLTDLARRLQLDLGYLSRRVSRLKDQGLIDAERSPDDGRQVRLRLTPVGERAMAGLDEQAQADAAALLAPLEGAAQQRLLQALDQVRRLLEAPEASPAIALRPHGPGDIGWAVSVQGEGYAREQGWDLRFEALVARIAADFVDRFDPAREACWIAERRPGGLPERLGCVFLVQARDDAHDAPMPGTAQLRLLWVEPAARGTGLGRRLVSTCTEFARAAGYRRIELWTQSHLLAARALYAAEGYRCIEREPHASFGAEMVGERWRLLL